MTGEGEFLAFVEYVRKEAFHVAMAARNGNAEKAAETALSLCSQAAAKKRQLLGLPEPDPDTDYDPDFHADGTERLPGEPRREKGETVSGTLDLSELKREFGEG